MATLKETIMGCVCGDNSCHKTIYNMFYPTVYNVCMRYSSSKQEGEDFIQESFIKIFDNIEKFDTTTSTPNIKFGAWAKRISTNLCIDHLRKQRPLLCENYIVENISCQEEDLDDDKIQYNKSNIIEAVQKLSPRYKAVFNMYYFEGFSHKQISEKLGIKEGASKANLYCAKKKLKDILTKNYKLDY